MRRDGREQLRGHTSLTHHMVCSSFMPAVLFAQKCCAKELGRVRYLAQASTWGTTKKEAFTILAEDAGIMGS